MMPFVLAVLLAPPSSSNYGLARDGLEQGLEIARNSTPERAIEMLSVALDGMQQFPSELAEDADTLAQRDFALYALAFAYFASDDDDAAALAMDEAIRTTRGREVPLALFGPAFAQLHARRREALAALGTARIIVQCSDCTVVLDEAPATRTSEPLILGEYRVTVIEGDEVRSVAVVLTLADEDHTITMLGHAAPPPVVPRSSQPEHAGERIDTNPAEPARTRDRRLPRWAGITGTAIGIAVLVAGGIILSFDGRCPNRADPVLHPSDCPKVYDAKPAGYSLLAAGAATTVTFGVLLTVGEVRQRRAGGSRVMLHHTLRF